MKLEHVRHAIAIALMLGPEAFEHEINEELDRVDAGNTWCIEASDLLAAEYFGYSESVAGLFVLTDKGREVLK